MTDPDSDPERSYLARRAALFQKLVARGRIDLREAGLRITAWEGSREAAGLDRYSPGFWDAGERWIDEWPERLSRLRDPEPDTGP